MDDIRIRATGNYKIAKSQIKEPSGKPPRVDIVSLLQLIILHFINPFLLPEIILTLIIALCLICDFDSC